MEREREKEGTRVERGGESEERDENGARERERVGGMRVRKRGESVMLERGVRRGRSMEKKGVSERLERSVRVKVKRG